ncbi:MAG: hypothetical protein ACR2IJ_05785 [Fluviibacter sp.]
MNSKTFKNKLAVALLLAAFPAIALAEENTALPEVSEGFRFSVTPYLWMPGISGNIDYNNVQRVQTGLNANKILSNLSIGAMGDAEVHYGRWGLMGNAMYSKLSNASSRSSLKEQALTEESTTDAWMGIYTIAGTYTAYSDSTFYLDALAGARFLNSNSKVQLAASVANTPYVGAKTLYSSVSATDAIGGIKGRVRLGESRFYVPFYVDAGGGSSVAKFTSQQVLGVGYAFSMVDISLVYANLYYSMSNDKISSYFSMSGPALAATFRF